MRRDGRRGERRKGGIEMCDESRESGEPSGDGRRERRGEIGDRSLIKRSGT